MKRTKQATTFSNAEAFVLAGRTGWRTVTVLKQQADSRLYVQDGTGKCAAFPREFVYASADQIKAAIARTREIHALVKAMHKEAEAVFTRLDRWVAIPLPEERESNP